MKHPYRWPMLFLFFLLTAFSYGNQIIYRYAVPPGGDVKGHNAIVQTILSGDYSQVLSYHTVWHAIVAAVTVLFHTQSLSVMAWLGPGLLVTMGLSIFYFCKRYFGLTAAFASVVLLGFFSNQPLQTLYDGGFPNVLAAGTVLPIVLVALDHLFSSQNRRKAQFFFGLGLLFLAFSHHLTTLYALPIIVIFLLSQAWLRLRNRGVSRIVLVVWMLALIILAVMGLAVLVSMKSISVGYLLAFFVRVDVTFPFVHLIGRLDNPNAIWPISIYPNGIGEAVVYLGLAGFVVASYRAWQGAYSGQGRAALLVVIWASVLFFASRVEALSFPVRLARDLAIPLAILGGIAVQTVTDYIVAKNLPRLFVYVFIGICIALGLVTSIERYKRMIVPNPLIYHLDVDSRGAEYITSNVKLDDVILIFHDDVYLKNFAPLHTIDFVDGPAVVKKLTNPITAISRLASADYVYVEVRHDRDESWINNQGIVEAYKALRYVELVATFKQPEKSVYLFKVDHALLPSPVG